MIKSGFFTATEVGGVPDRSYSADDFKKLFSLFFTSGVFANYGNELAVLSNNSLVTTVKSGFAFILGSWMENDGNKTFTHSANAGGTTRKDGIFVRMSTTDRSVTIVKREGDIVPLKTSVVSELLLCEVSVRPSATSITQEDINDKRFDSSVCGLVAGAVQQLDVTALYAQFTAAFNTWFAEMEGQLTTDAAGALQTQINNLYIVTDAIPASLLSNQVCFVRE